MMFSWRLVGPNLSRMFRNLADEQKKTEKCHGAQVDENCENDAKFCRKIEQVKRCRIPLKKI